MDSLGNKSPDQIQLSQKAGHALDEATRSKELTLGIVAPLLRSIAPTVSYWLVVAFVLDGITYYEVL
jgi:hypothetical protein